GAHGAEVFVSLEAQIDLRSEEPPQHGPELFGDRPHVDGSWLERLPPTEREELPGQARRAVGRVVDLAEAIAKRWLVRMSEQEVGVSLDDGQEVVEVVRDASGEPSERLEALRLVELFEELRAL